MRKLLSILLLLASLGGVCQAQLPTTNLPSVQLAWNPGSTQVSTYTVFEGTNSGIYFTNYPAGVNTSLTVSNLSRGVTYYFAATASSAGATSAYSTEVSFTTLTVPAAPSSVRIIIISP